MSTADPESHNEQQRKYFRSADQPTMLPSETAYSRRHFRMLTTSAEIGPNSRILEVGAGMGRFTWMFQEAGHEVVGTDISDGQIATLRTHFPTIEAFVADAAELPAPTRPYDAVVGFFILHHLPDLAAAFKSFARVLRPGGRVAFCEPSAFYFPFYLQILLTPRMRWSVERHTLDMRPGVLEPALTRAGFSSIRFVRYGYFPPQLHNNVVGRSVERGLEALPLPPVTRAFQVVTAQLPHGA